MFNEEDINDGESEEKLKSKTANLEGLLSKVNGKSIFNMLGFLKGDVRKYT